jgi:hypothetical protein
MARVLYDGVNLTLHLSFWEKIGGLKKGFVIPKNQLVSKTISKNPWSKDVLKGVRVFNLMLIRLLLISLTK